MQYTTVDPATNVFLARVYGVMKGGTKRLKHLFSTYEFLCRAGKCSGYQNKRKFTKISAEMFYGEQYDK